MINLIILGAGGHAKEVYSIVEIINASRPAKKYNILGFCDDITERMSLFNFKVFKSIDEIIDKNIKVASGVGAPQAKSVFIEKFQKRGFSLETIIHLTTFLNPFAKIGIGAVIQSYCLIQPGVKIGNYFSCNDHDFSKAKGIPARHTPSDGKISFGTR